jgi:hypothetical protein
MDSGGFDVGDAGLSAGFGGAEGGGDSNWQ